MLAPSGATGTSHSEASGGRVGISRELSQLSSDAGSVEVAAQSATVRRSWSAGMWASPISACARASGPRWCQRLSESTLDDLIAVAVRW